MKFSYNSEARENKSKQDENSVGIDWSCWSTEDTDKELNSLKEMCRETLRRHLLQLNAFRSLFQRVQMLGLT